MDSSTPLNTPVALQVPPETARPIARTGVRAPHSAFPSYACLYDPPQPDPAAEDANRLVAIAQAFSPRYARHGDRVIVIDVSGLGRLLGPPRTIGDELRRDAADRGARVHVAVACTHTAARLLALARPGVTIVDPGDEANRVAGLPIRFLQMLREVESVSSADGSADPLITVLNRWGLKTLGELAALPAAELSARLGHAGRLWQALAHGYDVRPFVPDLADERFEASLELEWPIEGVEPLSFVLTRLLEPLSIRLERRDRGAAALHVELRLVTNEVYSRCLDLPSPLRDVRTLRTLALLDLESHPPAAAIDRVDITIDPTPGRVLQHTLFSRAQPAPERLSTLLARLGALMGQDRLGAPATVDSYRPGAFTTARFAVDRVQSGERSSPCQAGTGAPAKERGADGERAAARTVECAPARVTCSLPDRAAVMSAFRRFRRPMPARVSMDGSYPCRVTTDRQGFPGGAVVALAGPWRTSGEWWAVDSAQPGPSGEPYRLDTPWNRDEWDLALGDGSVYRMFRDRDTDRWFIEGIVD